MQKVLPFTDDLQISLRRCYARFRAATVVCLILLLVALGAAYVLMRQANTRVLSETGDTLVRREEEFAKLLATWCNGVETYATNIANASVVQLSVAYYAGLSADERENLHQNGADVGATDGLDGANATSREDKELIAYLKEMFAFYSRSGNALDAAIVMKDGDVLLSSDGARELPASWKKLRDRAVASRSFQYGTMHTDDTRACIDVAVPVYPVVEGEQSEPLAYLLLTVPLQGAFLDLIAARSDDSGIGRLTFVQIEADKDGHVSYSAHRQGTQVVVSAVPGSGNGQPHPLELRQDQVVYVDHKPFYAMYYPSKEKIAGYVCAMVPQDHIDRLVEKQKFIILIGLSVVVAFLCLVLTLFSLLRDRAVRTLVNRRIAEQKAILDSINASIQDGMILLSRDGSVIYMNEHFFSAGGRASWVHLRLEDAMDKDAAETVLTCMRSVLQSGREGSVELYYGRESARRLYRVTIYPGQETEGLSRRVNLGCVVFFRDITDFRNKARESQQRVEKILNVFSTVIESVDSGLRGHTEKVLAIIDTLSPLLHFSKEEQDTLNIAARLFQVGKLFVPRHLLNKKGKLTPEEYALVCKAPEAAYELLYSLNFGLPVAETVYEMGERVDGRGPRGLKGDEILFTARVLSVVNAFCSMVSPRSYREAMTVEEAMNHLREDPGFDKEVVDSLCSISVKDFQTILRRCTGENTSFNAARSLWDNVGSRNAAAQASAAQPAQSGQPAQTSQASGEKPADAPKDASDASAAKDATSASK